MPSPQFDENSNRWSWNGKPCMAPIQGLFFVPSLRQFVGEDGTLYPYTFLALPPKYHDLDKPLIPIASMNPFNWPTDETVDSVTPVIRFGLPDEVTITQYDSDRTRYFVFTNKTKGTSTGEGDHSIGQLAKNLMLYGELYTRLHLTLELIAAGVL